jgi:hypothetical protein
MSSFDFNPALTNITMYTTKDSPTLFLFREKENNLFISCTIGGLSQRVDDFFSEIPEYVAICFTLFHQFDALVTTIVRRYMVEYEPESNIIEDFDQIELKIPIDDDFSKIDFVSNYYFLQVSFTNKHPGEMGISESIHVGKFFETKIPFILSNKEVQ